MVRWIFNGSPDARVNTTIESDRGRGADRVRITNANIVDVRTQEGNDSVRITNTTPATEGRLAESPNGVERVRNVFVHLGSGEDYFLLNSPHQSVDGSVRGGQGNDVFQLNVGQSVSGSNGYLTVHGGSGHDTVMVNGRGGFGLRRGDDGSFWLMDQYGNPTQLFEIEEIEVTQGDRVNRVDLGNLQIGTNATVALDMNTGRSNSR